MSDAQQFKRDVLETADTLLGIDALLKQAVAEVESYSIKLHGKALAYRSPDMLLHAQTLMKITGMLLAAETTCTASASLMRDIFK